MSIKGASKWLDWFLALNILIWIFFLEFPFVFCNLLLYSTYCIWCREQPDEEKRKERAAALDDVENPETTEIFFVCFRREAVDKVTE